MSSVGPCEYRSVCSVSSWIGATPPLLMSEFTDHSFLYQLKYEMLGARLGFHVLSLRVLVQYTILLNFSLPTQGLTFILRTMYVSNATSNFFDSYRYACNTRARWRTYKKLMSNLGYGKLYERSSGIPNFLNGM